MSSSQFLCLSLLFFLEGPHPIITSAEATPPQHLPSLSGFQPPEMDGSPVDFPCSILPGSTEEPPITTDQPDNAQVTTPELPITTDQQQPDNNAQVTAARKQPAVQSTLRKTRTQSTAAPIPRQPAAEVPISNGLGTPGSLLLYYLLANQNNRAVGGSSSQSDELYRSGLGRVWSQRNQQSHIPSYYQSYYQSHYPSYHPYQYPYHALRETVGSLSSSEEFGR